MKDFNDKIEEDLKFAKRAEEALKEHKKGKFVSKSKKDFINRLKEW